VSARLITVPLATAAALGAVTVSAAPRTAAATATPFVRIDTLGFAAAETKVAYLTSGRPVSGETFSVTDAQDNTVLSGDVAASSRGRWSRSYPAVYPLDVSALRQTGTFQVHVDGPATATSPRFRVFPSTAALDVPVVADGVTFMQVQRDGSDQVPGPLARRPSHLHDRHARVFQLPAFAHPVRSDAITGPLHAARSRRRVNASGGWSDAGDYLKFTHTAAYADLLLFASRRALGPAAPAALGAEAQFGRRWLAKMWDGRTRTLYLQVGIGSGNRAGTYLGDHDLWRLPQADDRDRSRKHRYAARHRPVFSAAPPGHRISPNLAGRVAAAFALASQNESADPARARHDLHRAVAIYRLADTASPPRPLVTAAPVGYYPEDSWHDDMALGAVEIALARRGLAANPSPYVARSARWLRAYLHHDSGSDTFNLYDTSALAAADLYPLLAKHRGRFALPARTVIAVLRAQIRAGMRHAADDPFGAGADETEFDVDSHTFGLMATVAMYDADTASSAFRAFATEQRDWLFGANPWGASFMVGVGADFPHCMQHQIANLARSRDGTAPLDVGAVVNGPNSAALFRGRLGGWQTGMRRCPADGIDRYAAFTGSGSRYLDDARSWETSEPAIDMTATAVLASALQAVDGDAMDISDTVSTSARDVTLFTP
jgi:endoglucanase